jgi:tRNA A37 methylthiotransferase MiaB
MFSFFIKVFGCPMRAIEAEKLKNYFIANGGKSAKRTDADILGIFGCSIIHATDTVTLEYLDELTKTSNKNQRIILFGCSPALSQTKISEIFDGEMLATKDLEEVDTLFPEFPIKFNDISLPVKSHSSLEYNKVYLKQYQHYYNKGFYIHKPKPDIIITGKGCPNACSYCSVRKALGPLKSYSENTIIQSYNESLKKRQKVFIFNGDDTGAFGTDTNTSFEALLLKMYQITPKNKHIRWAIDNLHPQWFIKYFDTILFLVESGILVDIVIPLQAATNKLLDLMRRKHKIEDVVPLFEKLKSLNSNVKITTHFIIGFPGETEKDIEAIKKITSKGWFEHVILLRYYESGEAYSHKLEPKISPIITQQNMQELQRHLQELNVICQMTDFE